MTDISTSLPTLGDPLPASVRTYLAANAGAGVPPASAFATAGFLATPDPAQLETGPRRVTRWASAADSPASLQDGLPRPPGEARHVLLCAVDGGTCLIEGVTRNGSTAANQASFAATITLDADGAIQRLIEHRSTIAAATMTPHDAATGATTSLFDAHVALDRYFEALDEGRFADAVECFSPDVLYSHPPYSHTNNNGSRRVEFNGRDELLAAFTARGPQRFGHELLACLQRGPHCLVEGRVDGLPSGVAGTFVSSLTLDAAGCIRRYVSFYAEPAPD
jgi:hypothetical protein